MCGDGGTGRRGGVVCCELCGGAAAVHCEADAAFLCAACDAKVHGANFLASRHRRTRVAGVVAAAGEDEEEGCDDESGTSSASSSCLSTADSATTTTATRMQRRLPGVRRRSPKRRARGEVVLEGWAKRMGLAAGAARRGAAAAGHALRACCRDVAMARVPLRVAMAAALWREVATAGAGQAGTLQRLEACSHVPARLVVAVASSMGRARARRQAAADAEEGWDECS